MVVTRACEKVQGDIIKIDILKKATTPRSRSGALKAGGHMRERSEKRFLRADREERSLRHIAAQNGTSIPLHPVTLRSIPGHSESIYTSIP